MSDTSSYRVGASKTGHCMHACSRRGSIRILIQAFDDTDFVNALAQEFVAHITRITNSAERLSQLDFISL